MMDIFFNSEYLIQLNDTQRVIREFWLNFFRHWIPFSCHFLCQTWLNPSILSYCLISQFCTQTKTILWFKFKFGKLMQSSHGIQCDLKMQIDWVKLEMRILSTEILWCKLTASHAASSQCNKQTNALCFECNYYPLFTSMRSDINCN